MNCPLSTHKSRSEPNRIEQQQRMQATNTRNSIDLTTNWDMKISLYCSYTHVHAHSTIHCYLTPYNYSALLLPIVKISTFLIEKMREKNSVTNNNIARYQFIYQLDTNAIISGGVEHKKNRARAHNVLKVKIYQKHR